MQACGVLIVVESCASMRGYCRQNGGWLQARYGREAYGPPCEISQAAHGAILVPEPRALSMKHGCTRSDGTLATDGGDARSGTASGRAHGKGEANTCLHIGTWRRM